MLFTILLFSANNGVMMSLKGYTIMYILKGKSLFPLYQLNTVSFMNNLMNLFVLSKSDQVLVNIISYLRKQIISTFSFLKLFNTNGKLVHQLSCTYLLVMLLFFEKSIESTLFKSALAFFMPEVPNNYPHKHKNGYDI